MEHIFMIEIFLVCQGFQPIKMTFEGKTVVAFEDGSLKAEMDKMIKLWIDRIRVKC